MEKRNIPGFPGYQVTADGRVWSDKQGGRWLRPASVKGYQQVSLYLDGKPYQRKVHVLVAEAFHGLRPDGMEVRHLNGDRADNRLANVVWGTHSDNLRDKVTHGTDHNAIKTHCPKGHLYSGRNKRGDRVCHTCHRNRMRAARAQHTANCR